ncbi:MAG: glycosyltransferase [Sulfuricella sp.]|nr:glycosyltransferase [Sulfuricella sp.]
MKRILVFAPHPDDEIIGCGGYLAANSAAKATIRVVVVSDGAQGLPFGGDAALRQTESRAGLAELDIGDVIFWNFPDRGVPLSGTIIEKYQAEVAAFRPDEILLPAPGEAHPDHRRVTRGALHALEGRWQGALRFYETTQPAPLVNTTSDISAHWEAKQRALGAHRSQLAQFDYLGHCESLARMRGIPAGCHHGEAFVAFDWDGAPENFFEGRPLISVVVRGDDPVFLGHALESLAAQEYDHLEVVLVWFGATPPQLDDFSVLDIRIVAGVPNRGKNLNLGIDAARGEYLAFLDQDDIYEPEHLAVLLAELQASPKADVAYAGCRVMACRRDGAAIQIAEQVAEMNRPLEPGRLLIGNTIPNHALLYRAATLRHYRFDEELPAYEDWELLARLDLAGYRFAHVDEITCEYRLFSADGTATLEQSHRDKGYLGWEKKVHERIVRDFAPRHLGQLAGLISGLEEKRDELEQELTAARTKVAELRQRDTDQKTSEDLLRRGLDALGIAQPGHAGLAALIGRSLPEQTLFSLIVPVYNTPAELLAETLDSLIGQAYPGWELCLVDDASDRPETLAALDSYRAAPALAGKLRYLRREENGGIVAATNDALALAGAPYLAFVDHDDVLHQEALLEIALALRDAPDLRLIYTDSTMIDHAGRPLNAYHKPDWAPETLLGMNFVNHLTVARRDDVLQIGGVHPGFDGSQDWDMLLRLAEIIPPPQIRHIPLPLYAWRATNESLAYRSHTKPGALAAGQRAVEAHLQRRGLGAVHCTPNPGGPGIASTWAGAPRRIEVIVPTHRNLEGLKTCVRGLLEETTYPDLHLTLVANRCETPEMQVYLAQLAEHPRVAIRPDPRAFNWAALNNAAAADSDSELLLFLNDDVEILEPGWLAAMNRYFELDGVGVVGATLLYPNGELQHNGVRTSTAWLADNIQSTGSYGELAVTRNVAAVTGACLLVRRDVFGAVGGFDERYAVNYNDVDFCLAVRHAGYRVVQAADARLVHHESISRGLHDTPQKKAGWEREMELLRNKWGDYLNDPYWTEYQVQAQGTRILNLV